MKYFRLVFKASYSFMQYTLYLAF